MLSKAGGIKAFQSTSRYHYIIDLHVYSIYEVSVTSIMLEACHCPLQQTHKIISHTILMLINDRPMSNKFC